MINWMKQADFWNKFESEYRPKKRFLNHDHYFEISMPDLRARIRENPVFSPDEGDFPGPVERWYGEIGGHLFIVTHYYRQDYPTASEISCEDNDEAKTTVLKHMEKLKAENPYKLLNHNHSAQ